MFLVGFCWFSMFFLYVCFVFFVGRGKEEGEEKHRKALVLFDFKEKNLGSL